MDISKFKKVYISGPITDNDPVIVERNIKKLYEAAKKFRIMGFEVINPDELQTIEEKKRFEWEDFMKVDLIEMFKCDFVAVLPNWESSRGCNLELFNASSVRMPIIDAVRLSEIKISYSVTKKIIR